MIKNQITPSRQQTARRLLWLRILLAVSLIWLIPTLACGSFAPRPTPTPTLPPAPDQIDQGAVLGEPSVQPVPTPIASTPVDTPTPAPTATFTPTPVPGTALSSGQPARITAPAGLNYRDAPNTGATLLGQFGTGQRVNVLEGPVSAEGYTWWNLDDGQGSVGWAADGDDTTEWISPRLGAPQPVNRPPRVGDRVAITMSAGGQLSIRALPGTDAPLITRVSPGQEYTVLAGPQSANGYTWYQIRSDDGSLEGWAADSEGAERWLSPLE